METVYGILTVLFLVSGSFFALTAAVGILKMPDFYSRVHPAGKSDTLAQMLISAGLFLQVFHKEDFGLHVGIKLILIILFLLITAPTAVHAIAKAARVDGIKVWKKESQAND